MIFLNNKIIGAREAKILSWLLAEIAGLNTTSRIRPSSPHIIAH